MKILFFGSTSDSAIVLDALTSHSITAVVTQPPKPIGRKQILTPTPTQVWAEIHDLPVLNFSTKAHHSVLYENEDVVVKTLASYTADVVISASYGQKIPMRTINSAHLGGINVHPSLLPRWRGADPLPWQILAGDTHAGVTLITLSERMDEGEIIAQEKMVLTQKEERESLRKELFIRGAHLLAKILPKYLSHGIVTKKQDNDQATVARRLTREDGYIPWDLLQVAMRGNTIAPSDRPLLFATIAKEDHWSMVVSRAVRALSPWPGVWTILPDQQRMKLLQTHTENYNLVLDRIQKEGKTPSAFTT